MASNPPISPLVVIFKRLGPAKYVSVTNNEAICFQQTNLTNTNDKTIKQQTFHLYYIK